MERSLANSTATKSGASKALRLGDIAYFSDGQVGGKVRGFEFFRMLLESKSDSLEAEFGGRVAVAMPKSSVLRTMFFLEFMENNRLWKDCSNGCTDQHVHERFLKAEFSPAQKEMIGEILSRHEGPIIVRSSALSEDNERASFAGIFSSICLPNACEEEKVRLMQFEAAIKLVFASTFTRRAKDYSRQAGIVGGEERMAVLVQDMVGMERPTPLGERLFYPEVSMAAFSFNDYHRKGQDPNNGFVRVTIGQGKGAVDLAGNTAMIADMGIRHDINNARETLHNSPTYFYALKLDGCKTLPLEEDAYLTKKARSIYGDAPAHIALRHTVWYDRNSQTIRYSIPFTNEGEYYKLIKFPEILDPGKKGSLAHVLVFMRDMLKRGFGMNVDFEAAADWVKEDGEERLVFYPLQARPQVRGDTARLKALPRVNEEDTILRAHDAVGSGKYFLNTIVYVPEEKFSYDASARIGDEIYSINRELGSNGSAKKIAYVLPRRFGSSDPTMGIRGGFEHISNAAVIVENTKKDVGATRGSHFFEDVRGSGMGYMSFEDKAWLDEKNMENLASKVEERRFAKIYKYQKELEMAIDEDGNAVLYKK